MFKSLFKNYIYPVATLVGSIIGVGFLALPYITLKVGIWPMLFYFAVLTTFITFMHVTFGQISLKTPDHKMWPGFVGFYFGKWAQRIVLFLITMGLIGVLLAYLIIGGEFLSNILIPFFGGSSLIYVLIYFVLASAFVYFGEKTISKLDFLAISSLLIILLVVLIKGYSNIKFANIFTNQPFFSDFKTMFLPYGAIMFSLWGVGLIPQIEEMVVKNKKSLKSIIIVGTLTASVFYLLFIFLILSITGAKTTESALIGLSDFLPKSIVWVALLIGVITTFIAFITQGLLLKKILMYDARVPEFGAWIFVCFAPLLLFFLGLNSFISLISFIGGFLLPIDGILISLMYLKTGGKKIVAYPLVLVFVLGIIYTVFYYIN